jgi:hypothetical protein
MQQVTGMSEKASDNYITIVLLILASFGGLMLLLIVYGGNIGELVGRTSKEQLAFLIRLVLAMLCAVLAHAFVRHWFRACLAASLAFSLINVIVSLCGGYTLGPFFAIGLIVLFLLGFAVAAPVGLVFRLLRTSKDANHSPKSKA